MQVKTVQKWEKVLDNSIKTMRFLWRHAIVLGMLGMMIKVVDLYTANWRNILISLAIAGLVDFFKMKIKLSRYHGNDGNDHIFRKNFGIKDADWVRDPSQIGSATWNMNPSIPGTSAYYCRQNNSRYN